MTLTPLARRLVGTRRRGVKAWHVDTKRMVAHVPADAASPDATALACSPVEPVFALATASAPGQPGAPPPCSNSDRAQRGRLSAGGRDACVHERAALAGPTRTGCP